MKEQEQSRKAGTRKVRTSNPRFQICNFKSVMSNLKSPSSALKFDHLTISTFNDFLPLNHLAFSSHRSQRQLPGLAPLQSAHPQAAPRTPSSRLWGS
jgi:hypothetical protein